MLEQIKNYPQRELDNLCMFPKNTISKYENGKAIIDHNQLNRLEKELGVKLPRPWDQFDQRNEGLKDKFIT